MSKIIYGLLLSIDKEFNFAVKYAKGHSDMFHYWMNKYHSIPLLISIKRALGGSIQDLLVQGSNALHCNCNNFIPYFHDIFQCPMLRTYYYKYCLLFFICLKLLHFCLFVPFLTFQYDL